MDFQWTLELFGGYFGALGPYRWGLGPYRWGPTLWDAVPGGKIPDFSYILVDFRIF